MARNSLQAVADMTNMASRSLTTAIVMRRESGFSREVQITVEDLPLGEVNLFNKKMEKSLNLSQDSMKTQSLKRKCHEQSYRFRPYCTPSITSAPSSHLTNVRKCNGQHPCTYHFHHSYPISPHNQEIF